MIIISCKTYNFIFKLNFFIVNSNDYISSIEYIDNKFDEIIIKEKNKDFTLYRNLKKYWHNPIGPAFIQYKKDNLIDKKLYYFNNKNYSFEDFQKVVKKYKEKNE